MTNINSTPQTVSLTRNPNLSAPKADRSSPHEILKTWGESWWTGLAPEKCPGFDFKNQYLKSLPLVNLEICTRQDVLDYFNNSWTLTELLFLSLKHESTYTRPPYHQLRHPLAFYYGHPAVLFINKLRLAGLVDQPVDLYLEKVLETGVDEMSWDDMSKNEMVWPRVEAIHTYRKKTYEIIKNLILTHPALDPDYRRTNKILLNGQNPLWALFMGFEHEKIHFETSSVLIRELPIELVETPRFWAPLGGRKSSSPMRPKVNIDFPDNSWVKKGSQKIKYGKGENTPSFGWDNEYGLRETQVKDFQWTQSLISNGEFYEFVASGAYSEDKYWASEGLMWRKFRNSKRPTFWVAYGPEGLHEYKLRTIFEIIEMPWDWPAEVNFHEAQAFCRWKQEQDRSQLHYRLITEAEFVSIKNNLENDPVLQKYSMSKWEGDSSTNKNFNFNFQLSSPRSVNTGPAVEGIYDLFGNVWQWAEDQFNPLDGFKVNRLYDDFSTPCFDGKHQMILGGSFISCGHEASVHARFHFRPHFFQHAGFRIAASLDGSSDNFSVKLKDNSEYVHSRRENILDQMQNINWWHTPHQPMELSVDEMKKNLQLVQNFVIKFESHLKSVSPKGLALDVETNDVSKGFSLGYQSTKNFPEKPESMERLIRFIEEEVAPQGQQPGHPGYMAYVAGAANPISAPAQTLAMTLNQFTGHYSLSPGLVSIELEVIQWFLNLFNYPEQRAMGLLTSGGSQANMMAMVAARNKVFRNSSDFSKARFYASTQVHHCIGKSLAFLGFSPASLRLVEVNEQNKIIPEELERMLNEDIQQGLKPVAIIATAGSTNTGSVDPLEKLADLAEKYKIWFHIDGAYGAFFALTEKGQRLLRGIDRSDSIALDPHKALQMPYGVGALLMKDKQDLHLTYSGSSSYMPPSPGLENESLNRIDFADLSPELSRDPRGLRVWMPLKVFGIGPFKLNLEEKIELCQFLFKQLKNIPEIVQVTDPDLSILSFRLANPEKTKKLLSWINSKNKVFLSGCEINGLYSIRVCLLGYRLHFEMVETLIQLIKQGIYEQS